MLGKRTFSFGVFFFAQPEAPLPTRNDHPCQGSLGVSSWHKAERHLSALKQALCVLRRVCTPGLFFLNH